MENDGGDSTIRLWDAETGELIRRIWLWGYHSDSIVFSPDGKTIASANSYIPDSWYFIQLYDVDTGQSIRTFIGPTDVVLSVAFSPDGKKIVSRSQDNNVRLWNVNTGQLLTLTGHTNDVLSVSFSPDRKTIASCSDDGTVRLWNADTGQPLRTITGYTEPIFSIALGPDGKINRKWKFGRHHLSMGNEHRTTSPNNHWA